MISQRQKLRARGFAILALLFELGVLFAYGFSGIFKVEATKNSAGIDLDQSSLLISYILTAILALLGYGLIIAYSQNSAISGLTITLIVVSVGVQVAPLLNSFWTSVFTGFNSTIPMSLGIEQQAMTLCISLLVAFTSLVGKVGPLQTLLITLVFNIGWTLSLAASKQIYQNYGPSGNTVFDDNGTNYVYVFAGFFGLITSLILNIKKAKLHIVKSRQSAMLALIGTGFVFATFPFTGISYPATSVNFLRAYESPLNIYFTLTASVIVTYISSAIFGKGKVGVRESLIGVISGGVTVSVVSGVVLNIGACIAIGAFSGFVSGFWFRVIHPRINGGSIIDNLGLFGPILINAILGGFVLAPSLYQSYMNQDFPIISSSDIIKYQLAYIGVAAGTGIVSGLIAGLLSLGFRQPNKDFHFSKLVSQDFGLYMAPRPQNNRNINDTNTKLNKGQL